MKKSSLYFLCLLFLSVVLANFATKEVKAQGPWVPPSSDPNYYYATLNGAKSDPVAH
jgi:hypothetical protein